MKIVSITTNRNTELLAEQIREYSPESVVIQDNDAFKSFKEKYYFPEVEVLQGEEGLNEISARDNYDILVSALVGFSGLSPTLSAIQSGKNIALANKETLVIAGKIINKLLQKHKTGLYPIDSEHSAIFQCLIGEPADSVSKLIITASGGPLRNKSMEEIKHTTVEEALNHPNWVMGKKITIDSATMMNKGLEIIEAHWLFNLPPEKLEVLIHPQSVVHSMVEFKDNSIKAQLGIPDMKIPIQFALTYPERINSDFSKMDFLKYNNLTFEEPDFEKFRCLKLSYEALNSGGTYPAVLNAANEIAVELFLKGRIDFLTIPGIIEDELNIHESKSEFTIEDIIETDKKVRRDLEKWYR